MPKKPKAPPFWKTYKAPNAVEDISAPEEYVSPAVRNIDRPKNADGTIQLDQSVGAFNPLVDQFPGVKFSTSKSVDDSAMKMLGNTGKVPVQKSFSIGDSAKKLLPFASNIINSMRKPPMPIAPQMLDHIIPRKINLDASRVDINRAVRGQTLNARKNLDANTAAAVEMAGMSQGLNALNGVNTQEQNTNTQLGLQADQVNAGIDAQNGQLRNGYNNSLVERQIAQQRNQAENVANAADKAMAIEDNNNRLALDERKFGVLSTMYNSSGVLQRAMDVMKKNGVTGLPEYKRMGGRLKKVC